MSTGTLLGVWAHPDDEAYLMAGLALRARAARQRVVVVTATWGEHGTDDPGRWPPAVLRRQRKRELERSLDVLGVHEHRALELEDGTCAELPLAVGSDLVREVVEQVRPDTIVTFGPDGMTGHPDHRAVSRWTARAWRDAGRGRLWYATATDRFHRRWGGLNDAVGLWMSEDRPCSRDDDLAQVVRLRGAQLDRKLAALRAHTTQTAPLERQVGSRRYRRWWAEEAFREAGDPRKPAGRGTEGASDTVMTTEA